ncbi:MAG: peptide-binding protein [Chitinophagaceae bacterium]|nr:peptide-binding protein [Chitinophagaceae bacterium]
MQKIHFIVIVTILLSIFFSATSSAQVLIDSTLTIQSADSTAIELPFAIADEKRLSEEDLKNKREGIYFTGVPEFSSDPLNGFGYGVEGSLYFNGKRSDPFFAFTPYRRKLDLVIFNTTNNQREVMLKLDIPYIFNTKWRLRVEGGYEVNPNLLYFGNTEQSLQGLSYYPNGDSTQTPVKNASYRDYKNSFSSANENYNGYTKQEFIFNISAEHSFFDGKVRVLGGYELADFNITTFNGKSLLQQEYNAGKVLGVGHGLISMVQAGVVYDTRDLETDPGKGIFAEITDEFSTTALGSSYNFNKTFFQIKAYQRLLPSVFKKMILTGRFGSGYTAWDAPFFEYQDEWSSEGSIEGLGGAHTIRGYKQARFMARGMTFGNIELRTRFAQTTLFKQHLAFSAVPFVDFGGVWDTFDHATNINNYRYAEGLGLRIAWNVNTILRFDYAVSKEDAQFFFNFGHTF